MQKFTSVVVSYDIEALSQTKDAAQQEEEEEHADSI
jgi:hypothetical protein